MMTRGKLMLELAKRNNESVIHARHRFGCAWCSDRESWPGKGKWSRKIEQCDRIMQSATRLYRRYMQMYELGIVDRDRLTKIASRTMRIRCKALGAKTNIYNSFFGRCEKCKQWQRWAIDAVGH